MRPRVGNCDQGFPCSHFGISVPSGFNGAAGPAREIDFGGEFAVEQRGDAGAPAGDRHAVPFARGLYQAPGRRLVAEERPQCQLAGVPATSFATSSRIWISTEVGIQFVGSEL